MLRGATSAAALAAAVFIRNGAAQPPLPPEVTDAEGPVVIRYEGATDRAEAGPHGGGGDTTASRFFDDVPDPKLIYRKRALHPGAAIGIHVLRHDEVYHVLAGRGELTVGEQRFEVVAGAAIYLREGTPVGLRQLGDEDLVIIIAYPPFVE